MTESAFTNTPKTLKVWSQIVAKAWIYPDFEKRLRDFPKEVLEEHGITVPTELDVRVEPNVQVEPIQGDSRPEALPPFKLSIPRGVPITIPASLEVTVEAVEQNTEFPNQRKFVVSIGVSGVEVEVTDTSESRRLRLILLLPQKPSGVDLEKSQDKLTRIATGLEEWPGFDSGQECDEGLKDGL